MFKIKVLIAIKVIWLWSFSEHTSIMAPKVCKLTFASRHPPPRVPCAIIIHFRYCSSSSFCNHQFSFLWSCWQVLSMFCHPSGVLFCSFNKCVSSCVCMASSKFQSLSCLWHYLLVNVHLSANNRSWKMYWCDGVSYWLFSLSLWCGFNAAKSWYLYLKIAGALDGFPQQLNSLNHCIMTHWGGAY